MTSVGATASAAEAVKAISSVAKTATMPSLLIDSPVCCSCSCSRSPLLGEGRAVQAVDDPWVGHRGPALGGGERACGWSGPDGRGLDGRASLFKAGCGMAPPRDGSGVNSRSEHGRDSLPGLPQSQHFYVE